MLIGLLITIVMVVSWLLVGLLHMASLNPPRRSAVRLEIWARTDDEMFGPERTRLVDGKSVKGMRLVLSDEAWPVKGGQVSLLSLLVKYKLERLESETLVLLRAEALENDLMLVEWLGPRRELPNHHTVERRKDW